MVTWTEPFELESRSRGSSPIAKRREGAARRGRTIIDSTNEPQPMNMTLCCATVV